MFYMCVASAALVFTSCGDKKEEGGDKKMTACDCKKEAEDLLKKTASADPSKAEDLKKEAEALEEDCKDYKEEDYKDCK